MNFILDKINFEDKKVYVDEQLSAQELSDLIDHLEVEDLDEWRIIAEDDYSLIDLSI